MNDLCDSYPSMLGKKLQQIRSRLKRRVANLRAENAVLLTEVERLQVLVGELVTAATEVLRVFNQVFHDGSYVGSEMRDAIAKAKEAIGE